MAVRRRRWVNAKGEKLERWVVDYFDTQGTRRLKTFARKKEADLFAATAAVEVRDGVHVADSASATVTEAGDLWIKAGEAAGLERSTLEQYRTHLDLHIVPFLGTTLLTKLTVPAIRSFEDKLRDEGRSPAMIRKVRGSLGALLSDAQERGLTIRNAVRETSKARRAGRERQSEKRQKGRLRVGVDIPSPTEVKQFVGALGALDDKWRPILLTATFTGLRASELRGLTWQAVDLKEATLHVFQRADRFNDIGRPKSASGDRRVPLPPIVVNTLREWRLACPNGELGLVFPNGSGKVESLANIINRGLIPAMKRAGITTDTGKIDEKGRPILAAKYTGMHALRHFYASWCINRREDGGLGLPPKLVQDRLGHSSITMTMDTYGHLFPATDDENEMATAERILLGLSAT